MNKEEFRNKVEQKLSGSGTYFEDIPVITGHVVFELIDQLDELERVVVPQFVADWYERRDCRNLDSAITYECSILNQLTESEMSKFDKWFESEKNPIETIIKMKLYGYEVEKEPLYVVRFMECIEYTVFERDKDGNITEDGTCKCGTKLSEKEIKTIDERYWAFAVGVKE